MLSGNSRNNHILFSYFHLLIAIIINILIRFSFTIGNGLITRLNNGNFIIFGSDRTYILDPTYTQLIDLGSTVSRGKEYDNIAHFSEEDDGYIIFINQ